MFSKLTSLFKKKETEEERLAREHVEKLKLEEQRKKEQIRLAREYEERQRKEEEKRLLEQQEKEKQLQEKANVEKFLFDGMKILFPYFCSEIITASGLFSTFAKFHNELSQDVSRKDLFKLLFELATGASKCNSFAELDDFYNPIRNKEIYTKFFKDICYRNSYTMQFYKKENSSSDSRLEIYSRGFTEQGGILGSEVFLCHLLDCSNYMFDCLQESLSTYQTDTSNLNYMDDFFDIEVAGIYSSYQGTIFNYTIYYLYGMIRAIIAPKYIQAILENEEFIVVVNNFLEKNGFENGTNDLYQIYKEFYSDAFPDELSFQDFNLVIYIYAMVSFKSTPPEEKKSIIDLLGINYENLISRFLESNETNIFKFITSIVNDEQFNTLIVHDKCEVFAFILQVLLAEELIGQISFEEWFNMFLDINDFKEKCALYHKKYQLLNMDTSKLNAIKEIKNVYSNIQSGEEFEVFLKSLYELMGYTVSLTPTTGDQGADLILAKDDYKVVVQAKFYSSPVGNKAVQEVVAALKYYNADKGMVVTNNTFTKSALALAQANDVILVDGNSLVNSIDIFL